VSYWVHVVSPGCHLDHANNHTSNTSRMWHEAGAPLEDWDGKPVTEVIEPLRTAVARLASEPRFVEYAAPNGWGTVESTLRFLRAVLSDCEAHPDGTLDVNR
jgi:hypothetical protein